MRYELIYIYLFVKPCQKEIALQSDTRRTKGSISKGKGRKERAGRNCVQGGEIVFLGTYEEVIGTLKKVWREGDHCIVVFTFEREVLLPADAISMDRLRRMQGKQIGLLNCDGAYKVRYIKNNE